MAVYDVFTPECLNDLFPIQRTNDFFDALFGDAEEGAYDIRLVAPRKLCDEVSDVVHDSESLLSMSSRALKEFDGRGTERIRDIFKRKIFKI